MIGLCYNEYSILPIVGYIWYSREYASGMMIVSTREQVYDFHVVSTIAIGGND